MLAAPVAVDRIALYPVANYGSAMAPFYTILSIWVGAIILVAMLKVSISDHEKARILGWAMICRSVRKWVFARP